MVGSIQGGVEGIRARLIGRHRLVTILLMSLAVMVTTRRMPLLSIVSRITIASCG